MTHVSIKNTTIKSTEWIVKKVVSVNKKTLGQLNITRIGIDGYYEIK